MDSNTQAVATEEQDAYGVDQFCRRNNISRAYLYLLWRRGEGPKFIQLGARRLISREAATEWRRSLERQPSEAKAAA
jgi:hypothetical protein